MLNVVGTVFFSIIVIRSEHELNANAQLFINLRSAHEQRNNETTKMNLDFVIWLEECPWPIIFINNIWCALHHSIGDDNKVFLMPSIYLCFETKASLHRRALFVHIRIKQHERKKLFLSLFYNQNEKSRNQFSIPN